MRRSANKIVVLALFFVAILSTSFAQESSRVGIVNPMQVMEQSAEGKSILARLEKKSKENQDKLVKMDDRIRDLETRINTQRLTLTQESLMNMSSDLERMRTDRKRFAEDSYREFTQLRDRLFNKVKTELIPIIEEIGKEKNMVAIFDLTNSGVIYYLPTIDLTEEVIKKYDASKTSKK
ncbi:MAG: OmpH family outer membrane protein [Candidatus Aminicenantes bacterium]|nr:OmpH family outer membrane protein [Candidatus Aminicenantes bacterium]